MVKIAPPESLSIIGSNHIDTAGDLYVIEINSISKPNNKRNKRLLDLIISVLVILLSPVLFFIQEKKLRYFSNTLKVLFGFYTWVGYGTNSDRTLPKIKHSVFSPTMLIEKETLNEQKIKITNLQYAKNYELEKDLKIIWHFIKQLGI